MQQPGRSFPVPIVPACAHPSHDTRLSSQEVLHLTQQSRLCLRCRPTGYSGKESIQLVAGQWDALLWEKGRWQRGYRGVGSVQQV